MSPRPELGCPRLVPLEPAVPQLIGPPVTGSEPPQLMVVVWTGVVLKELSRSAKAAYLSLMAEKLVAVLAGGGGAAAAVAELRGVAERGCRLPELAKGCRGAEEQNHTLRSHAQNFKGKVKLPTEAYDIDP